MDSIDTLKAVLAREEISAADASRRMGRVSSYVGTMLNKNKKKTISMDIASDLCEVVGYEIVVRSRDDGFEFIVNE